MFNYRKRLLFAYGHIVIEKNEVEMKWIRLKCCDYETRESLKLQMECLLRTVEYLVPVAEIPSSFWTQNRL